MELRVNGRIIPIALVWRERGSTQLSSMGDLEAMLGQNVVLTTTNGRSGRSNTFHTRLHRIASMKTNEDTVPCLETANLSCPGKKHQLLEIGLGGFQIVLDESK